MIDKGHPLPVTGQARMLGLSRSIIYYEPVGDSEADLALMTAIDEIHMKLPFYGARRLRDELRDQGFAVGREHTSTLMRRSREEVAARIWLTVPALRSCTGLRRTAAAGASLSSHGVSAAWAA